MITSHTITRFQIKVGKKGSCAMCPVALALRATFATKQNPYPAVYADYSWLRAGHRKARTPSEVKVFMSKFDMEEPVEPLTFTINWRPM